MGCSSSSAVDKALKNIEEPDVRAKPPKCGQTVRARVIDVYDGDTCTVTYFLDDKLTVPFTTKIRVFGIDCPELHPKKGKSNYPDQEKRAARYVQVYTEKYLLDKVVDLGVVKWDKYGGRIDASITTNLWSLAEHLLSLGYAKVYNGKKKESWDLPELMVIIESFHPS